MIFSVVETDVGQFALVAIGAARCASIASIVEQPKVCLAYLVLWNVLDKCALHGKRCSGRRLDEAKAVAHPEDVRVDC